MVVFDVCARRRRGTDAERKSTSSVIGPCLDLAFQIYIYIYIHIYSG